METSNAEMITFESMTHDVNETRLLLKSFAKVIKFDYESFCPTAGKALATYVNYRMHVLEGDRGRELDVIMANAHVTGSIADGAGFCRWFNKNFATYEVDIMGTMGTIPAHLERDVMASVYDHPGFYRVVQSEALFDCLLPELIEKDPEMVNAFRDTNCSFTIDGDERRFMNTIPLKMLVAEIAKFRNESDSAKAIAAVILGTNPYETRVETDCQLEGPSSNMVFRVLERNETIFEVSIDRVFTFSLDFYPNSTTSWLDENRRKYWPPGDVFSEASSSKLSIVPKAVPGSKDITIWRLSFSFQERVLMRCIQDNDTHRYCYFISKSIYYFRLKRITVRKNDEDVFLGSYIIKTTMLWMLEETDPDDWKMDHMGQIVRTLYARLEFYLSKGHLPNFFVPEMNVLEGYPDELIEKVREAVVDIKNDPCKSIPDNIPQTLQRGEDSLEKIKILYEFLNTTSSFYPLDE